MQGGSIVLTPLPQADGQSKNRPALVLCTMRPFGDLLICGISRQLHLLVSDFDEVIASTDSDFEGSGLATPSLIRLGFMSTVPLTAVKGSIGAIGVDRYRELLARLARYLSGFAAT
jgi:mRNA interferase MazF